MTHSLDPLFLQGLKWNFVQGYKDGKWVKNENAK